MLRLIGNQIFNAGHDFVEQCFAIDQAAETYGNLVDRRGAGMGQKNKPGI
jgi:hypothetical protein